MGVLCRPGSSPKTMSSAYTSLILESEYRVSRERGTRDRGTVTMAGHLMVLKVKGLEESLWSSSGKVP